MRHQFTLMLDIWPEGTPAELGPMAWLTILIFLTGSVMIFVRSHRK